jgi:glutamate synthase domain-containing protein 1/glutamate synthase domain-containing protein 3
MIFPSGCGVLGILRKENANKIAGYKVVRAIERVRYRGSDKGAGFAVFNQGEKNYYVARAFYFGDYLELKRELNSKGIDITDIQIDYLNEKYCSCTFYIHLNNITNLRKVVRDINEILWREGMKGRIYSLGNSLRVFKGVGYPKDVASIYKIEEIEGDLWLAHTRQPTNSPGYYPYWSHPFSGFNIAIVHNGDISSFGANMEYLMSRGWGGFVGTDSEVIAFLFEELLNEGLSIEEVVKIIINPSRRQKIIDDFTDYYYRGARLDGPFTAVIGYDDGDDLYLIGIADRAKFRPILIGEDDNYYFIASEENEIREISPSAKVWRIKPGSYFIASMKKGIISYGREFEEIRTFSSLPTIIPKKYDILALNMSYRELNSKIAELLMEKNEVIVGGVMGHRFIGINLPRLNIKNKKIILYGVVGNAMANLNESNEFYVYGNVADDCCDTMHGGKVVIMGDAGDVLAQTFQNGKIFVKGNAGNRVGIQMREYKDRRPYLVIGGLVDDYLGEYMAGGVIVVLGLNSKSEPVGNYIGTGMVGGRIYIRGKISPNKLGLQPNKYEVINLLKALLIEGYINNEEFEILKENSYIEIMDKLKGEAKKYAKKLFEEKVGIPQYEYRELNEEEFKELEPIIKEYEINIGVKCEELLSEKFTVITARRK